APFSVREKYLRGGPLLLSTQRYVRNSAFFSRVSKGYSVPSRILRLADFIISIISLGYASPSLIIDKMQNSKTPFRIWLAVLSIFIVIGFLSLFQICHTKIIHFIILCNTYYLLF